MNLNEVKEGQTVLVTKVGGLKKQRHHLLDLGLIPGTAVKIIKRAPMGDPIELRLHGYELAIRSNQAESISVTKPIDKVIDEKSEEKLLEDVSINDSLEKPLSGDELYCLSKLGDCSKCKVQCKNSKKKKEQKKVVKRELKNSKIVTEVKQAADLEASQEKKPLLGDLSTKEHPGIGEPGKYHKAEDENPLPSNKTITFALVGNQNCGKTTLFNTLTGSSQHVGNFPGVTVERKDGQIQGQENTIVTDLPGVYSLSPYSKEEIVTRTFVLKPDVDCIINIVDATSLERSLYLTMQLMELDIPVVIALNMMDEIAKNHDTILVNELERSLGVSVVPISAAKNQGIDELVDHAMHVAKFQEMPLKQDFCFNDKRGGAVHRALHSIMHEIERNATKAKIPIRFASEKIAESDHLVMEALNLNKNQKSSINHTLIEMESECKLDRVAAIADMRYRFILGITKKCVIHGEKSYARERSEKIDKILTGKFTAIPAFILIMALVFWLTFDVIGGTLQTWLSMGIDAMDDACCAAMEQANISPTVQSFVSDGLFAGVGSVLSFMPIIIVMFFFLSLLEDSGYMARVAFVMDRLLRKIGLSGRSIVPMLVGFGCSVPAVMATRTLPSERDRKLTILLIPYMSCSAKLPVYAFFAAVFFPNYAGLVTVSLYFIGILVGIVIALCKKGKTKPVPFIMELPDYRLPSAKNVLHLLWDKSKDFLQKAFTVILIATIVIWFLQSFDFTFNMVEDPQDSILAQLAGFISPIFAPLGFGDWRIVTSLLTGFIAKESVVATASVLFGSTEAPLAVMAPVCAFGFLVFCLLYTPCVAAIASIRREIGTLRALGVVVFQCVVAWVVAFLAVLIGTLIIGAL